MMETWITTAGTVLASMAGGGLAGLAARRTRQDRRRDDFTTVTDRMGQEIVRLQARADRQERRISGQGAAIEWLVEDRRRLMAWIRKLGATPPEPEPIPEAARPYLDHIGM